MPSPNPTTRREFRGAAKATTLSAQIVNGTDTSFTVTDATGWPTGGTGKFVVTINAGFTDEEKILCLSRTGTTVTVDTRGYDGTTAAGHAAGATAVHTLSAFDADEWNQHTNASTAVHGVATVAGLTETQVFTNKTLTAPAIASPAYSGTATGSLAGLTATGATLDAASTVGGVSGTSLAADRTAWTAYTPTFTNCTSPVGQFAYKQIGKTVFIRGSFTSGTVTATGVILVSLPGGMTAAGTGGALQYVHGEAATVATTGLWITGPGSGSGATVFQSQGSVTGGGQLINLGFNGVIEVV